MENGRIAPVPQAVLFDLDGTLIDTYRLYLECYRRALEPHLGCTPSDAEIAARRPASERRFLTDWLGEETGAACHVEMRRLYGELYRSMAEGAYPGVAEMLAALRAGGVRLGIVTGKGREAWDVTRTFTDVGP